MSGMKKTDAVTDFRELIGNSLRGDLIAQRETWHNYVDGLRNDNLITQKQRDSWSCPIKS
jgi:hypothetical protein